jgi:4-hydroxybenzoate polyprenyltransferase
MAWDEATEGLSEPDDHRVGSTTSRGRSAAVPIGPPVALLIAAAVAAACAYALLALGGTAAHIGGWAAGSLLTIGLVTLYTTVDVRRSESTLYLPRAALGVVRAGILAAGIGAAALHAWSYATHLAS